MRGNAITGVVPTHLDNLYDVRLRGRLGYEFGWFMPFVAGGAVINESYQSTVAPATTSAPTTSRSATRSVPVST